MSLKLGSIISGIEDLSERIGGQPKGTDGSADTGNDSSETGTGATPDGANDPETIAGIPLIDPIAEPIIGTSTRPGTGTIISGEPDRPRRGRPRGPNYKPRATTGSTQEKTSPDLKGLDGLILSAHLMCAKILSVPELELDESESKRLADSLKEVAKHYSVIMDPKRIAWWEFATTAGGIYGPRVVAIWKNTERKPKGKMQPIRVEPIPEAQVVNERPREKGVTGLEVPSQLWNDSGALSE